MTAPTPEKIQRYDTELQYIGTGEYVAVFSKSDCGDSVMYEDHLRHLKLAQIAVLEELLSELVPMSHDNGYRVRAVPQVCFLNKIEEIRREIG